MDIPDIELRMLHSVLPLVTALALQAPQRPDSLALARQFTVWLYTGQVDSLFAHHPADAQRDTTLRRRIRESVDQLALRAGTETSVIEEKFVKRNGRTQYWRTAKFTDFDQPLLVRWVLNPDGTIGGIGMGPLSQAPPIDPQ
jgi:hypothetical protein